MEDKKTSLPEFVEALLKPGAYPHRPQRIEMVQTQISFAFLTGDYVYKVKKPVDFGFLDFTSLEKRRHFCEQEVVLNSRLCPGVYLGVVNITEQDRVISAEGEGEAIEYAVKMRQLPQERMMDRLLRRGEVIAEMMERVAKRLADFHQQAATSPEITRFGGLETNHRNTVENLEQTRKYIDITIPGWQYQVIEAYAMGFLERNVPLFERRMAGGRIRDCHGDLHAAHVCFSDSIYIFDCIEFNDRFRYSDVAGDIAFLAMDLDFHGRSDLSRHFVDSYVRLSGDAELRELLDFFKCYRAYVRGKVESFKLDDPHISSEEKGKALEVARRYFDLALSYAQGSISPALFITTGLIGTGKSTLAQALAQRLGIEVVSSDMVRKKLAGIKPTERRYESFEGGIYSPEFSRKTYAQLFQEVERQLKEGRSVIIDASFRKAPERAQARALAAENGARFYAIECVCDETIIRERLAERQSSGLSVSDGRPEIFVDIKADFEPLTDIPEQSRIVVDTGGAPEEAAKQAIHKIYERGK